jgi:hypothetical protein
MKTVQLNKTSIELPDCWEDLTWKEKVFTFGIMAELFADAVTPEVARLKMLIEYTGYQPSWIRLFRESFRLGDEEREIIIFNLLKLSETLTFAFTVEENRIVPNYCFKTAPVRHLKIGGKIYAGRRFERDVSARTDITAREFADCFDLLSAQQHLNAEADRNACTDQICAILYPKINDYRQNMVSEHHRQMRFVAPEIKFGILLWFTGIVKFYTDHPVYSLIFQRNRTQEDTGGKVSLGMNEIILSLQKEGYGNPETMTVNDYFDAQVKYLKDIINKALAEGIKPDRLSQKSGIPIGVIHKLS